MGLDRMIYGIQTDAVVPQAHRWALLGNAVSVQVAAWIGKALMHPHRHKYQGARDRRFIGMSVPEDAEDCKSRHPNRRMHDPAYDNRPR